MSEFDIIRRALKRARRAQNQRRLASIVQATLWATLCVVAIGAVVLGVTYSRSLHAAILLGWGALLALIWFGRGVWPSIRARRDEHTARLLEQNSDELRNDLTSALEFGAAFERSGSVGVERFGSPALIEAHLEQTTERVKRHLPLWISRLPRHDMPRLRKVGLGLVVATLVLFLITPSTVRTGLERLFVGPAPSPLVTVVGPDRVEELLVGAIRVIYRYPPYTERQPVHLDNATGRIEVLSGTEVTLEATALEDASSAVLLMTPRGEGEPTTELDMDVVGRSIRVSFTPLQDATYTFGLSNRGASRRVDPVDREIRVIPDSVPQIELITPDSVVNAAPDEVIPFRFAASDDFGLIEISFAHSFAGDSEREQQQSLVTLDGDLVFQDQAGFDLSPLALQPRDEVVVFIEATDNDTIGGPKAGRSRGVLIRITSPEDRHLEIMAREEALFEAFLTILGDYLENPIADLRLTQNGLTFEVPDLRPDEYSARFTSARSISSRLGETLGEMRAVLDAMESDELMLRRDYELMLSSYERLYGLFRDEQDVLASMGSAASRGRLGRYQLERVERIRQPQVGGTEEVILLLEEVVDAQQMESMVRTLEELENIQGRLRELLQQYQETQDPALREEIERELARLEARMRELLQRLAEQMENMPSEHYNVEALEEMGMLGDVEDMTSALERIREMLERGDIEGALQALDDLDSQVSQMLQQMSESQEAGGGGISELDQRVEELMNELNDLEAQESEIEDQTEALQEEIRERRTEEVQRELEEFVEQARQEVAEMQELLEEADSEQISPHLREDLQAAEDRLGAMDGRLEQGDIASSLEQMEGLMQELMQAEMGLGGASRRESRRNGPNQEALEQAEENVQETQRRAARLESQLQELIERARPVPGPQDQQRLQELAEMQGQARQGMEQLRQRLTEMSEGLPMLEQELGPPMDGVGQNMQGAEQSLRGQQMPGALDNERQALQGLQQLRQQMHQMVARERMGRREQGQTSRETVEIPEEPDETPAEFRRDILDAMRDDSLEGYRDAIRDYYQALVE